MEGDESVSLVASYSSRRLGRGGNVRKTEMTVVKRRYSPGGDAGDAMTSIQDPSAYGGEILVTGWEATRLKVGNRQPAEWKEKQQAGVPHWPSWYPP